MKKIILHVAVAVLTVAGCGVMAVSCQTKPVSPEAQLSTVGNPYMPLWEHIPDGEPYVFEDPDQPGKYRVYVYGLHMRMKNQKKE